MNKKKIILSMIVFITMLTLTGVAKVKAAPTDNVLGWIWGGTEDGLGNTSGLGWISTNNLNPKAGGAIGYGINIPPTGVTAGSGYLWSENVGEIDFEPQNHCTTGVPAAGQYKALSCTPPSGVAGVFRPVPGELEGWARFVQIAKASAENRSGGWEGWIKLKGNAQNGAPYGVSIDPASGELSGYAWSDELGTISFRGLTTGAHASEYGAEIIIVAAGAPQVTLIPGTTSINVKDMPLPQTVTLTWSSNDPLANCVASSSDGTTWNENLVGNSGTKVITVNTGMNEIFTVTCTNTLSVSGLATASIYTYCFPQACSATSQVCDDNPSAGISVKVDNDLGCKVEPPSTCSLDSDCTARDAGAWKEVEP